MTCNDTGKENCKKHVLITGATGVIGSRLVAVFLAREESELYLLIRADSEEHLQTRLRELLKFLEVNADNHRSRIHAVRGDLSEPELGVDSETFEPLRRKISHIVHAAGDVRLNQDMASARKSAVSTMENVLAFGRKCLEHGQLKKIDVVSTVGVAGKQKPPLLEEPVTGEREFHNTYEAAKAESEELALAAAREGMPLTIHRPSMIVGDSVTGKVISFQVFYYLCDFLSGRRTMGFVPRVGDFKLDIVPVDYVAEAIYLTNTDERTAGAIFNLCSGEEESVKLSALIDSRPQPRQLPIWLFSLCAALLSLFLPAKTRRKLKGLPFFLSYLENPQTFDNTSTRKYLTTRGCRLPPVSDYLGLVRAVYDAR